MSWVDSVVIVVGQCSCSWRAHQACNSSGGDAEVRRVAAHLVQRRSAGASGRTRCPRRPWPSPARRSAGTGRRTRPRCGAAAAVAEPASARSRPASSVSCRSSAQPARAPRPPRRRRPPRPRRAPARPGRRRRGRPVERRRAARPAPRAAPRRVWSRSSRSSWQMRGQRPRPAGAPRRAGRARRPRAWPPRRRVEVGRLAGELGVERGRAAPRRPGRRTAPPIAQQGVVAGGAGARPVAGSCSSPSRIFSTTTHAPPVRVGQPAQVAARVGQAVRVVDPQPVDRALGRPARAAARGSRRRPPVVLDPDRGQRVDVEEPPVVQLLVADPPVREPVVLAVEQLVQRQVLGARPDREHVVEVAQHRLVAVPASSASSPSATHLADPPAQHRHQDRPRSCAAQSTSNQCAYGEAGPVAQHRPQRRVERRRRRDRHVVGHDVDDDAQAVLAARRRRAGRTPRRPPRSARSAARGRPRRSRASTRARPAGRGQVDVRDPEVVQVAAARAAASSKPNSGAQLQPVGGRSVACAGPSRRAQTTRRQHQDRPRLQRRPALAGLGRRPVVDQRRSAVSSDDLPSARRTPRRGG